MSPAETSELERRLGAGLEARARRVTVPGLDQGRDAIADRVVRRRRHRRTIQAAAVVVVVIALVAAGVGLNRHRRQSDQVVTGLHQQVPPLPQLGLPTSVGQTSVTFLWPGNGVIELVSHLPQFSDELSVVVSDQGLDDLRQERSGPGVSVAAATVDGRPAFTVQPNAASTQLAPDPSGVYWKPDAHHVAVLAPRGQTVTQAVVLAGRLVNLSDSAWWSISGGAPSGGDSARNSTGVTVVGRRGHRLDDPAARLGLPGGRTTAMELNSLSQQVVSALDVPGFPAGSFTLTTDFDVPFTAPLAKAGAKGTAAVRGTTGLEQDTGPTEFHTVHSHTLSWLEHGQIFQIQYGPPVRWDGRRPIAEGRVPTLADAQRVAAQLRVLSLGTWQAMLSPRSLRLDLTTPGVMPCLTEGACAATPSGSSTTSPTTTSGPTTPTGN